MNIEYRVLKRELRNQVANNREKILFLKGEKCYICGFDFVDILEVHHIQPIKYGGGNNLDNLTVLCPSCHKMVHYMVTDKYLSDNHTVENTEEWFNENFTKNEKTKLFKLVLRAVNIDK